jgi:threonylcarbamoyladenosine tRNA methylthiotransferase MtaB
MSIKFKKTPNQYISNLSHSPHSSFLISTLGCKVNQYESDRLAAQLNQYGIAMQGKGDTADIHIVNTCAVTSFAERKSRYTVAKIRRRNPNAQIIVCGCASQLNPDQFKQYNPIAIFGTEKQQVLDHLSNQYNHFNYPHSSLALINTRNRVFIKAQDGCNNFCSYCIVPHLRGRSRSRQIWEIVDEINMLPEHVREVVITGIDLSSYGLDIGATLADLASAVSKTNRPAFRLSSLEVGVVTQQFLNTLKECKNFQPSFHLSLQSGSEFVLKSMNRKYTPAQYLDRVNLIRATFPNAQITTDVIVGFPTETDAHFIETVEFVKAVKFLNVHIFPYSARSGTPAAQMPQLQSSIITNRVNELTQIQKQITNEILSAYVGKSFVVLVESSCREFHRAITSDYISVRVRREKPLSGDFINVLIESVDSDGYLIARDITV